MLTGKRAFDGQSAAGVIAAILEREPPPTGVKPALERLIARCLAKDPEQRFQTARDLRAALNWAVEQTPAGTAPKKGPRMVDCPAGCHCPGRKRWLDHQSSGA